MSWKVIEQMIPRHHQAGQMGINVHSLVVQLQH